VLDILRRHHHAPDGNPDNRAWYDQTGVQRLSAGLYRYPQRQLGVDPPPTWTVGLVWSLVAKNCSTNHVLPADIADAINDLISTATEESKLVRRTEAVRVLIELALKACGTALPELSEGALVRTLNTVAIAGLAVSMSAQARNAQYASPQITWNYLPTATTVPRQIITMPPAACPLAQLSGTWTGALTQPANPLVKAFTSGTQLTQTNGSLAGTARIEVPGSPQYYGVPPDHRNPVP
jgi:hypothetical protein